MKKIFLAALLFLVADAFSPLQAQVFRRGGRFVLRPRMRTQRPQANLPPFQSAVYFHTGYGLPNLDKNQLPGLAGAYRGTVSAAGPFTAALDYRFLRNMGIGILLSYGQVKAPYYDWNNALTLHARLSSWGILFSFMRYIPVSGEKVTPYFRTAIGVSSWSQQYQDAAGYPIQVNYSPEELAYQAGFGARFQFSKHTGCFIEAGYGKYILSGGLSVKL